MTVIKDYENKYHIKSHLRLFFKTGGELYNKMMEGINDFYEEFNDVACYKVIYYKSSKSAHKAIDNIYRMYIDSLLTVAKYGKRINENEHKK